MTAKEEDTKYKAEALHKWLGTQDGIDGGIVRPSGGWFVHCGKKYSYDLSYDGWTDLNTLLGDS